MYRINIYVPPIIAPFNIPFFFIFILTIELPINILTVVIAIIDGEIMLSDVFVYVNMAANTINSNIVIINDIIIPIIIFIIVLFFIFCIFSIFPLQNIVRFYGTPINHFLFYL